MKIRPACASTFRFAETEPVHAGEGFIDPDQEGFEHVVHPQVLSGCVEDLIFRQTVLADIPPGFFRGGGFKKYERIPPFTFVHGMDANFMSERHFNGARQSGKGEGQ